MFQSSPLTVYKEQETDINIRGWGHEVRAESGHKHLPAAPSTTKTEMPACPTSIWVQAKLFLPALPPLNPNICSTAPAAQHLARGLCLDNHCPAKKITKLFNVTSYCEQETIEKKKKSKVK